MQQTCVTPAAAALKPGAQRHGRMMAFAPALRLGYGQLGDVSEYLAALRPGTPPTE